MKKWTKQMRKLKFYLAKWKLFLIPRKLFLVLSEAEKKILKKKIIQDGYIKETKQTRRGGGRIYEFHTGNFHAWLLLVFL